jgi:hypothetical protein
MEKICSISILPGSKIFGRSGACLVVDQVEGSLIICGGRRVDISAVVKVIPPEPKQPPVKVEPPPHEPEGIEIGDRLARSALPKKPYPKGWFPDGIDDRPTYIDAISATVTDLSADGCWASTDEGNQYHVSQYAIDCGDWKTVRQNNQQN